MIFAESRGAGGEGSLLGVTPPPHGDEALRWSRFVPSTDAEGPGTRATVWMQGCAVHCPGCFNPHLWATRGAQLNDPAALAAEWVDAAVSAGAEGITLLGGEPFDQAGALAVVAEAFRAAGLGVMAFSGYTLGRLQEWSQERPDIARLLAATDLLCDGPYLAGLPDTRRPWIGSRNQSIRALTPRYAAAVERIARDGGQDALEVRIGPDGAVAVNGWATDAALAALLDDLGVRGDRAASLRKEPSR
ncbi:4Fe-4S single cluster domain-containing protein [Microbacterium sp. NPDC077663]|uniref:4Fe-4S single cluster domain-containing protein n=1 Tax=Microbacterium sp. NPDC077663 TaxID=3364189 RepID=UPI0037CAAA54